MEAVIFVGIQGCGKSTLFRERFEDTHIRLNLDMLKTRRREKLLIEACLEAKQPFVVDNTNPTRTDRERYLPKAKAAGFRTVAYWFDVDFEECKRRNASRLGKKVVPPFVLSIIRKKMELPSTVEGFDEVHRVTVGPNGSVVVE